MTYTTIVTIEVRETATHRTVGHAKIEDLAGESKNHVIGSIKGGFALCLERVIEQTMDEEEK